MRIKHHGCVYVHSALAGYKEDNGGSGDVDDGQEDYQHLMTSNALQRTVYIASRLATVQLHTLT